jgi:cytoskeleton protein RodZ
VETGIGATLREARNRRKIDLSEVEAATKIRLRFLRAIENEEWDVLPGEIYTRAFIRTYASYLGLDGERLADEYRRDVGSPEVERSSRIEPVASARGGSSARPPGWVWAAGVSVALIGIAIGVGLAGGGDEATPTPAGNPNGAERENADANATTVISRPGVAVQLAATAEVWVCLLNGKEEPLIDGHILAPGAKEGPFRSGSFTVSFGNGEVTMRVDGKRAEIPVTSSPIGYEIDDDGELTELEEAERPTCA